MISPSTLEERRRQPDGPLLLDVRTPIEVREACIAGVAQVPLDELNAAEFAKEHGEEAQVVVICRSGKRARNAAEKLAASGMKNVSVLEGGMEAWEAEGLPVQRDRKVIVLDRQVRITTGILILSGWMLGTWVHPAWFGVCAFMGAGLIFSGVANFCGLALILAKAPWNKGAQCRSSTGG